MAELAEWHRSLVLQKNHRRGAIPAGFEWMIRFNKINDVDFETFQEDFNLQAEGEGRNVFSSAAKAIERVYPHIKIKHQDFDNGREKIEFIKDLIDRNIPCMIKFAISSKNNTTHEMPVVIYDELYMRFIWQVVDIKKPDMLRVAYDDIMTRHNKCDEAREVAWLEPQA